jgi:hypothetical protein
LETILGHGRARYFAAMKNGDVEYCASGEYKFDMKLKTLLLTIVIFSGAAHAGSRQVKVDGADADRLQDIFREAGKHSSSGIIPFFAMSPTALTFETIGKAVTVNCRAFSVGGSSSSTCTVTLDPAHSAASAVVENRSANITEAALFDPVIVAKLERALGGTEFTSEAKAADGLLPRLHLNCAEKICRITIAN